MITIVASTGELILVDLVDYEYLSQFRWHVERNPTTQYAWRNVKIGNRRTCIKMHREMFNLENGEKIEVDHINHDGLDNRRCNLRLVTSSQNKMNKPARRDNSSGYKGVTMFKRTGRYLAQVKANGVAHYLGYFDTAEEAARARDKAAKEIHGIYAYLNFPEGEKI